MTPLSKPIWRSGPRGPHGLSPVRGAPAHAALFLLHVHAEGRNRARGGPTAHARVRRPVGPFQWPDY
eukprot:14225410-Alexandrium_andersonii.AAC.1